MADRPGATAAVGTATATPVRRAPQLASHAGRRCVVLEEDGG